MEITRARAIKAWMHALRASPDDVRKTLRHGGHYRVAIYDRFRPPLDDAFDEPLEVPHVEFRMEVGGVPDYPKARGYRIIADGKWVVDGWVVDGRSTFRFTDDELRDMERLRIGG